MEEKEKEKENKIDILARRELVRRAKIEAVREISDNLVLAFWGKFDAENAPQIVKEICDNYIKELKEVYARYGRANKGYI